MVYQDGKEIIATAQERFGSYEYVKASQLLRELLTRDPSNAEARHWLGKSLSRRQRSVEAIAQFQEAMKQGFDTADVHVELGNAYLKQSKNKKELEPVRQQKFVLALTEFDSAIAAEPTQATPRRVEAGLTAGKACVERAGGDETQYDRAISYFEAAIAADPTRIEARLEAGRVCLKRAESKKGHYDKAQHDKALAYFEAAIAVDPTQLEARLEAGQACLKRAESEKGHHDKAQYDRALAYFESALQQAPDSEYVYDTLKEVVPQLPDHDSVLSRWCKIVQQHKLLDAHLRLGCMLWALDKPELALKQFLAAARRLDLSSRELSDRDPVEQFLSLLNGDRKTVADPRSILTTAKRSLKSARDPRAHALWACGLSLADLQNAAMDDWQQALQQAPADIDCHALLRRVLYPRRRRRTKYKPLDPRLELLRADQVTELVTKIQPIIDASSEPLAHLEWGRTLRGLGKHDDAGREFERSDLAEGYAEWGALSAFEGNADLAKERFLRAFDLAEASGNTSKLVADYRDGLASVLRNAKDPSLLIDRIDAPIRGSTIPDLFVWWTDELAALKRPEDALRRFEDAVRLGSTEIWKLELPAFVAAVSDNPVWLQDLILISKKNKQPADYSELVDLLIKLKRPFEAFDCCKTWMELEPAGAKACHKLGQVHSLRRDFDKSIDAFKKAIELDPELGAAYTNYLEAIGARDQNLGAVATLVNAFDSWNKNLDAKIDWRAVDRLRETHVKSARELIEKVELYIDSASIYGQIVHLLDVQGMHGEALKLLARLHEHWPELDDHYLFYVWGACLSKLGDYKGAINKLQHAIALNPDWYYYYYLRAGCYENREQYGLAALAYKRALRKGKRFGSGDEIRSKAEAYSSWGRVLCSARKYDEALEKSRLALELNPSDYWSHFQRAYTLSEMMLDEQAIAEYEVAVLNGPSPHAHQNIAGLYDNAGHYRATRQKLKEISEIYQRGIADKLRERDAYYCLYYAYACVDIGQERKAKELLYAAVFLDPNILDVQISFAKLFFKLTKAEMRRSAETNSGRADSVSFLTAPARFKAIEHYRKAEEFLNRYLRLRPTINNWLKLGELHLLNDEWDKAKAAFEQAMRMDPDSIRGRTALAETHLQLGDAAGAIRHLKTAIGRAPMDLSALLLHAQACRRAEQLEDAEAGYGRVLEIAPCHVDALVGRGEVYLDMVPRRGKSNSAGVAELYTKAINSLAKAIDLFESPDAPLNIASNLASTHYLLGYAQVQYYEISVLRRDKALLTQALQNFNSCLRRETAHVKARRAIESIEEDHRSARAQLDRYAAPAIIFMTIVVFVLAQFGLLVGRPIHPQNIMLTPASLAQAKAAGLSEDLLGKVKEIENVAFETSEKLAARTKELMGSENFSKLGTTLIERAERKKADWRFEPIDLGTYAVLTFGSLLFMVAGAFLPQLTSLKLAGMQLEKVSAERIETKQTLTIEK